MSKAPKVFKVKRMRVLLFRVVVTRGISAPDGKPLVFSQEVKSQNVMYAAASGLSLAGWNYAECIEVTALQPVPGRPVLTTFRQCSVGGYGFCFVSRT